jgi:CubicO group peptidase (beta-lactamase class C family)
VSLATRLEKLPARLGELAERYRVPGAALAVMCGDEIVEAANGVVNANTGVEATTDSVFQIGSITKLFTATLVMQLVDEGLVELDVPVQRYLPELRLADFDTARAVTLRHLLTHTSGIDGDFFEDTGRGDDCVERYVIACAALPQLHPLGAMFSYCNAGFVIAGRVIEKLRGKPWGAVLRERILAPIGAHSMGTEPEQAILHRASVGHMLDPESGEPRVVPIWRLSTSGGPAGATPFATARDLLAFARLHLDDGRAPNGTRVLTAASAGAMREKQLDVPAACLASAWGLGFMLFDWGGARVIGHDGATIGQSSFLRILPERRIAAALLTNGGEAERLCRDVFVELFGELAGVSPPALPEPTQGLELDLERYTGRYRRLCGRVDVERVDGELKATQSWQRPPLSLLPAQIATLRAVDAGTFLARSDPPIPDRPVDFLEFDPQGRPAYVCVGGRASPRVA